MLPTPPTSFGVVPGKTILPSAFTAEEMVQAQNTVAKSLQDYLPGVDFSPGSTLHSIVVRALAMVYLVSRQEWEQVRQTQSLKAVLANPGLSSNDVVDAILSNLQVTRRSGTYATGKIKVTFSRFISFTLPTSSRFSSAEGLQFVPLQNYRLTDSPQEPQDLQIYGATTDQPYVLIPVRAVSKGVAYKLGGGTQFSINPTVPSMVLATAFGNFEGGSDDETNEDLIARLPEAMAVKNLSSRLSIQSTIKDLFPEVSDVNVIGSYDLAMSRNSHNIFNFKQGGFADIYFRTAAGILTGSAVVPATLVDIDEGVSPARATYRIDLGRDSFPGHYFVRAVRPVSSALGSYLIKSETKGRDVTVDDSLDATLVQGNLIPKDVEAVYSRYQTNAILFEIEYDETLGTVVTDQFEDTISVSVEVAYLPLVKEIQNRILDRSTGIILADYLVKAAIPCLVSIPGITVEASSSGVVPDVRSAIYNYINGLKIGETLKIDELVLRVREVAGVTAVRLPVKVTGDIYTPGGGILLLREEGNVVVPNRPDLYVTPSNTAFFIELADINVNIVLP